MSEPELKHLLERIKKVDAVVTAIAGELAEQRADIEEIFRFLQREFDNAAAAVRDHDKRLKVVESSSGSIRIWTALSSITMTACLLLK